MSEAARDDNTGLDAVRSGIVEAAQARFAEFGYTKTTLNEIAAQAGMSSANLYRFFENKLDIAAAVARRLLLQREQALQAALSSEQGLQAQLLAYASAAMRFDRALDAEQPHLSRMLEKILEEVPALALQHRKVRQDLLVSILQDAIRRGEVVQQEPNQLAQALRIALYLFETAALHRQNPPAEMERVAQRVVEMLVHGLAQNSTGKAEWN